MEWFFGGTGAVSSVNDKTGAISLNYSDVGESSTTGTNAGKTWGINISGNAATCNETKLEWSGNIAWDNTFWIAAWNSDGTLIKALNKNSFAPASHTHNYAGSSSSINCFNC